MKLKHANSILKYCEYFCQISSKSIVIILSCSVSKLVRFLGPVYYYYYYYYYYCCCYYYYYCCYYCCCFCLIVAFFELFHVSLVSSGLICLAFLS